MTNIQVFLVHANSALTKITIVGDAAPFSVEFDTLHAQLGRYVSPPKPGFATAKEALAHALKMMQNASPLSGTIKKVQNEISDLLSREDVRSVVSAAGITAPVEDY